MKTVAAAALAALIFPGCEKAPPDTPAAAPQKPQDADGAELHIYTWSDYIDPEIIEEFEKAHDCRVIVDTFDSNETMYAKLKAGGIGYDIVTPSSYLVSLMASEGLIQKLDHGKLPNVKANFDQSFTGQILDPSFTYNVPYAVTYTGFAYRKDRIGKAPIDSWRVFECEELKGRMSLLSDMRETIGGALKCLGY